MYWKADIDTILPNKYIYLTTVQHHVQSQNENKTKRGTVEFWRRNQYSEFEYLQH